MSNKVAIIVAPNGARKQKTDHKSIPISIQEIVDDVKECRKAGAIMAHVHARNSEGQHSLEIDDNLKLLEALESKLGDSIIIQLTTEAIERYTPSQQMQLIREVKPPAASFALRELLPSPTVSSQTIDFFHWVAEQNILAQYILYNQEDVERYSKLCRSNMLPKKGRHALFVLGSYRNNSINYPKDLLPFLYDEFITTEHWGACAFGENEFNCLSAVMLLGEIFALVSKIIIVRVAET